LTREQETSRKREREAEIYRKGARCLGLYTEILSSDLPQASRTRQPNMIYGSNLSDKGTKKNWSDKDEHSHKSSCVNEEMLTDEGILMAIN
jgi:hypothetical protein